MDLDKAGVWDVLQNHDLAPMLRVLHAEAWLGYHLRTTFSPAQPRSRWSATFSQATTVLSWGFREQGGPSQAHLTLLSPTRCCMKKRGRRLCSHCARPTRAFGGRALREQKSM